MAGEMKGKTVNLFGLKINFFGRKSTKKPNIFFNAFRIDDTDEGKMIKVVPVGSFPNHHDGAHVIEPQQIREMAENIKNGGTDILFDFGHDSIWNSSARAAAWSPKEKAEAREDGLYIQYPTFTKSGMEAIENGEFRYFSPAYLMSAKDKQGRIIGAYLHSVGLTNKPYMDVEIDHVANSQIAEETDMKISPEALAKLGLDENATEAQINAAILAQSADPEADQEPEGGADSAAAEEAPENSALAAVNSMLQAINQRLDGVEKRFTDQDAANAEALVNGAIAAKKIRPAEKDAWLALAKSNFAQAKEQLSAIKANTAGPGRMNIDVSKPEEGKPQTSAQKLNAAADFFRENRAS